MSVANILTIDGKLNVPVITDNITTNLLFSDNLTSPIINTNTINLTSSNGLTIKNIDGFSIANLDDNTFNVISQELKCASLYCAGGSTYIDTNGLLTNTLYVSSIKPSGTSIFIKKSNGTGIFEFSNTNTVCYTNLTLNNTRVINSADPIDSGDLVNLYYLSNNYATTSSLSNYLTITNAASTYMPLAGGTMTGNISANNNNITYVNTGNFKYIQPYDNLSTNITFRSYDTLTNFLILNSTTATFSGGLGLSGNIVPVSGSTYNIGSSSFPFASLYIGYIQSPYFKLGNISLSTNLYLSQSNKFTTTDYAVSQTSAGYTSINASTGQAVDLKINDTSVLKVETNKLTVPNGNIGYIASGLAGSSGVYFGNSNVFNTTGFAIGQSFLGNTYINAPTGQNIYFLNNAVNMMTITSTLVNVNSGFSSIFPQTTTSYTCGTAAKLWTAVYAQNGTIITSDLNKKKDITSLSLQSQTINNFINGLRPVTYKWNSGNDQTSAHCGFISQEVDLLCDQLDFMENDIAVKDIDENGAEHWGLRSHELIAPIVLYIQKLNERITQLEAQLNNQ